MGAVIAYFVLIFIEGYDFSIIVDLMFSTNENYVNLHSLILIISMMMIVQISHEAGLFQFISIYLIKFSKGKPIPLMIILCCVTVLISAILNNILTVIILIPLTITISRILNINPTPYILTQAILVNIGGTLFSISSIPNILIVTYAGISFLDFLINVGLLSLLGFSLTLGFFIILYKKELKIPEGSLNVLKEYNVWNVVQSKRLLYLSMISLLSLFFFFIVVPQEIIPPDIIALTLGILMIILSKLEPKEIFSKIDIELILYLIGIFVIAGSLELLNVLDVVGEFISQVGGGDTYVLLLLVLWISAFLSSSIDNIPITKVLIPVIGEIPGITSETIRRRLYYSLALGANWGDNLTPLGDNILVVNIAEQNKRPISFKQFMKLGFITTIYQLFIMTIYFTIVFKFVIGIIVLFMIIVIIIIIYLFTKNGSGKIRNKILNILSNLRNYIIR